MPRILLIDAYSQIYRVFYAIRMLNNPAGEPVNAVYGMARLFLQLDELMPSAWGAIVFDHGKCMRRTMLLPQYKAQRPPMPDELRSQTAPIRQWVEAFGWNLVQRDGFEADDLISGITAQRGDNQALVLSSDKDLFQLVRDNEVSMLVKGASPKIPWEEAGEEATRKKFGVQPTQLCDYLALLGDASDNIPGIEGIGAKTAVKLLAEFGDIDTLLAHLGDVASAKLRQTLENSVEDLKRNRELVRLDQILPEDWRGLDGIVRRTPDWDRLEAMAAEQGFNTICEAIRKRRTKTTPQPPPSQTVRQGMLF